MRTHPRVRFTRRTLLSATVCLWAQWMCMTNPTTASEALAETASEDWWGAVKSILAADAEVVPICSPWCVAGPFDHAEFVTPFPPEGNAAHWNRDETYRGRSNRELAWRETEIPEGNDFDLRSLCPGYQKDGTFYLFRTVTVDRDCVYATAMRGMSGLAVWVNGRQLIDRGPGDGWLGGGWEPKEALLLPLDRGVNRLLVRVDGLHKNNAWGFRHGKPEAGALRYTLSMTLRRTYPTAAAPLGWLRRDGLDLLKLWPQQRRDAEFSQRMKEATVAVLAQADTWLAFLRDAGVPEPDFAQPAGSMADIRRRFEAGEQPLQVYLAANAVNRRVQNLPQAQVVQNWLALDELSVLSPMDDKVRATIAAALNRGELLLRDHEARLPATNGGNAAGQWQRRFGELRSRLKSSSPSPDSAALRELYVDAHAAVRELVFANPLLQFGKLVFYKRYSPRTMNIHRHQFPSARYMDWSAQPGGDLCVLPDLRPDAKPTPLLRDRLGKGIIRGYDLSYDAGRIVLGFWNAEIKRPAPKIRFEYDCYVTEGHTNLYELDLDQDRVRQLTSEPWHDIDPCYLPNGRIAFASERCGHNAQCDPNPWSEPMVNLYTISGEGGDVRRLTSHKDNDNFARVLEDGRVSYTRWEYHERGGLLRTQSLWASRPDGAQEDALFKEHLDLPFSLEEARAVPGSTSIVAVATGHHTNPAGAIVRIDTTRGISSVEAMQIVTPGVSEFEGGLGGVPVPEGGVGGYGYYSTPWPLSEKYFLVAYNPGRYPIGGEGPSKGIPWGHYLVGVPDVDMARAEGYGLYVIDVYGNRELIYRDPDISCLSPVPMIPRPSPPILTGVTDARSDDATLLITDVHQGLDVPKGTVKSIRISEAMPWPYTKQGASRYPREYDYTMKRTIKFDVTQPYQFGSGKSKLVTLLKQGHEKVELSHNEWLILLTWIDNNGLYLGSFVSVHDWGRWGYRPQASDMHAVRAVQKRRCIACHADVDLARPGWIDPRDPRASLFLTAPLVSEAGGRGKCQPPIFRSVNDPDYRALLDETRKIWNRMRQDPTPGMKELIAGEPVHISQNDLASESDPDF